MFIKIFNEKDSEDLHALTGDDLKDTKCHICDKELDLDEPVCSCTKCSNIVHIACLNPDESPDGLPPKQFVCQKCMCGKKPSKKELSEADGKISINANGTKFELEKVRYTNLPKTCITIPESSPEIKEEVGYNKNRRCTDLYALLALVTVIICFVTVILCLGGLRAIEGAGSDSCGNICGEVNNNMLRDNHKCMSSDLTDKGLVMFVNYIGYPSDLASSPRECVSTCPKNMKQIFNYCIHFGYSNWSNPDDIHALKSTDISSKPVQLDSLGDLIQYILSIETSEMLSYEWIIRLWILSTVVSYFTVMIFCNFPFFSVWIVDTILRVIFMFVPFYVCYLLIMVGGFWLVWLLALNVIILIFNIRQIAKGKWKVVPLQNRFMAALHLKATVVLFNVPAFFLVAVVTMPVLATVVVVWCKIALWIESANQINTSFHATGATLQSVARWLNIILGIWTIEMIFNCQRMVIAGAVSRWHFAKSKVKLGWPLLKSFFFVIRYHIGTIAMGSVMFFPFLFIKFALERLFKNSVENHRRFIVALVALNYKVTDLLAIWLNPSSDLSFNESALTGESYCKSLSRSVDRQASIKNNYWLLHVRTSSMIVPFVIRSLIVFVTLISALFLFDLEDIFGALDEETNYLIAITVISAVSFITGHIFWTFYQIIIEQLFICILHEKSVIEEDSNVKPEETTVENKESEGTEPTASNPDPKEPIIIDLTNDEENKPNVKLPDKVEV